MTADTFPGSKTRHGTQSGWAKHLRDGERPCDPCFRAKSEYDARRNSAGPTQVKNRARARAQGLANSRLAAAHKAEYDALYQQAKAEVLAALGVDQ